MDISRLLAKLPVPQGLVRFLPGPLARIFQKETRAPVGPAMEGDDLLSAFEEDEYVEIGETGEEEEEEEPETEEEAEERKKSKRWQQLIHYGIRGGIGLGVVVVFFLLWWFGVFTYTFGGPDREAGSVPDPVPEEELTRSEREGATGEGKIEPPVATEEARERPGPRGKPPGPNIDVPLFPEVPEAENLAPLEPAPVGVLAEKTRGGVLPKTSGERMPRTAYARPYTASSGIGRVGVVITNLGRRDTPTKAAINRLPPDVTLAYSPYAKNVAEKVKTARKNGHEVLLELPMEPERFPIRDPGQLALVTFKSQSDNLDRLRRILARATGFPGVMGHMGDAFLNRDPGVLEPYFRELADRGLFYLHPRKTGTDAVTQAAGAVDLPTGAVDVRLHEAVTAEALDARLAKARQLAEDSGRAIVAAPARPLTFLRLVNWLDEYDTYAFDLAPITAVVLK